jgi:hypothetical protein
VKPSLQNSSRPQQDLWQTFSGRQQVRSPGVQMSFARGQHTWLQLLPLAQQISSPVHSVPFMQQDLKQTFSGRQHVRSFGVQTASAVEQHTPLQLLPLAQQTRAIVELSVVHVDPGQQSPELPQVPPSGTAVDGTQAPLQHCSSASRQHAVAPHGVLSLGQTQVPLVQRLAPPHAPHEPPQPSSPQPLPLQFGTQASVCVVCVALCFLAFLTHFFLCLPDFFLHFLRGSWASASDWASSGAKAPLRARASDRRRDPMAERKRVRRSKRVQSMLESA